jgi:hypothetical protein
MRTPDAIRTEALPAAPAPRLDLVPVEISQEAIEFLKKRGDEPRRSHASIAQAVSALLSDLVLEAIYVTR